MSTNQPPIDPSEVPKHPFERKTWIRTKLALRGQNLSDIARELGVRRQTVNDGMMRPMSRVEDAVAKALGLETKHLFPERFTPDGKRLHVPRGKSDQALQ